jgi:anti-sigma regulatory factor (Ser/Thr protein kinase)
MVIRVLVSNKTLPVHVTDQGSGGPIPEPEMPDRQVRLAGQQPQPGWGFFLIKRMRDDLRSPGDEAHHTIELFLYLEGGKPK